MKENKNKKKKKLGWKGAVLAVIVIIIAFILMGWHGFDFGGLGGGNGDSSSESTDSSDATNQSEDAEGQSEDEDANPSGVSDSDGEDTILSVVVDGNSLFYTMNYDDNEGLLETDVDALEMRIDEDTITRVDLYDRGAVKKTYDDIYKLLTDKGLTVVEKKE